MGGEMMIYTCTMNLAIDLFIKTLQMLPSEVNRTQEAVYIPNGKGVNVSFILKKLGMNNIALGFKAGFTGQFIEDELHKEGIQTQFVNVDGITRINVFTQVVSTSEEFKLVNPSYPIFLIVLTMDAVETFARSLNFIIEIEGISSICSSI